MHMINLSADDQAFAALVSDGGGKIGKKLLLDRFVQKLLRYFVLNAMCS